MVQEEPEEASDDELAAEEEGIAAAEASTPDSAARDAQDAVVIKGICGQAICSMQDQGIYIDPAEEKMALRLFPCVSNLFVHIYSNHLNQFLERLLALHAVFMIVEH